LTADRLAPLVKETRATIGNLAVQGLRQLNALSADKYYPMTLPVGLYGDRGYFAQRRVVRTVSPKINANRSIDGYPNLSVVGASSEYYVRKHFFVRIPSLRDPFHCAAIALPFSRSTEMLELDLVDKAELSPKWENTFTAGISARDSATVNKQYVSEPSPGFGIYIYDTAEAVQRSYSYAFTEALAMSGLVAHGMRAYDIDLKTSHAKALFNDWRHVQGSIPVTDNTFWTINNVNYLQAQLLNE
jgi:hypothetical protein